MYENQTHEELISRIKKLEKIEEGRSQVEEKLRESEEKFRLAFRTSPDCINLNRLEDGLYIDINDGFTSVIGYSRQEVIGKSSLELNIWKNPKDRDRLVSKLKKDGVVENLEAVFRRKNGKLSIGLMSARIITLHDEDVILSITRDITKLKRAEKALREREMQYRTLADSGIALIWTSGPDKRCDYFNKPWLDFTGRTMEQEIGDGWTAGVHPDDLPQCLHTYVTAFEKREKFSMEYRLQHISGEYRWVQEDGLPRFDAKGRFLGYIGHCLDITEGKKVKEKLRDSEEKFSLAFRISPNAIIINHAEDGKFIDANDAFFSMTGYMREEIMANTAMDLNLWADEKDRCRIITDLFHGKTVVGKTLMFRKKNRELITGLFSAQIMKLKKETLILSCINDISDLKQLESEQEKKQIELENINTALNILLKKRERDNQEMNEKIYSNYESVVLPLCHRLKNSLQHKHQQVLADMLEASLKEVTSPFAKRLSDPLVMLTPAEIQIAQMIKQGLSNKEIALSLNCSIKTIDSHRTNIRRKLGLKNMKLNLRSYLSGL
jgi:PAS domain S-box-containing protein